MSVRENEAFLAPERLAPAREVLERASTLPAEAFTSPAIYARERARLFAREWLCVGRVDQIPAPGDYFCLDLLGEKLVVVRGRDDREIRVLSRICRHRAAELVRGSGNARSFQCPYHAWTYRLDGGLVGAPHMEHAVGFDREACRLPQIASEIWEGWIFVNFDSRATPLGSRLAPLSQRLSHYGLSDLVAVETARFDSPFNWKVLVDNFMEAYHHIAIHRDTLEPLFPAQRSSSPDREGPFSILFMPPKNESEGGDDRAVLKMSLVGPLDADERGRLVAAVVYPFHLFAPSAHFVTWYQILPERFDRFELRIFTCFPRETLADPRHAEEVEAMLSLARAIHVEDLVACEAVWSGLNTPRFESGRLSPLEKSLWQFNQWWIDRMSDDR